MARITVLACDDCGSTETVERFEVKRGAQKATIDFCGDCGVSLDQLLTKHGTTPQKRTQGRGRAPKATSMGEIEKKKVIAKKK